MFASTAPAPVNMLWIRKPLGIWILRSRSEINARYGSIAVLLPASTSHRQITAIHSAVTSGKRNKMMIITRPPPRMYGLRRPHRGTPGLVAHRADERLDQQAGDRAGDVEDRQVVRLRPQEQEDRVHRALGEPEAELDAEEPEVHPGHVAGGHQGTALVVPRVLDLCRCDRHRKRSFPVDQADYVVWSAACPPVKPIRLFGAHRIRGMESRGSARRLSRSFGRTFQ